MGFLLMVVSMIISLVPSVLIYNFNHFTSILEMINLTMGSSIGNALQQAFGMLVLWVAFSEEITFRGLIQGLFGEGKSAVGIVVTTILFAVIHLHNHSVFSLIYLLAGGLAFSMMRVVTKGLWFPIGFHMAWDWVELSVFCHCRYIAVDLP